MVVVSTTSPLFFEVLQLASISASASAVIDVVTGLMFVVVCRTRSPTNVFMLSCISVPASTASDRTKNISLAAVTGHSTAKRNM